jgi:hypothetical protein
MTKRRCAKILLHVQRLFHPEYTLFLGRDACNALGREFADRLHSRDQLARPIVAEYLQAPVQNSLRELPRGQLVPGLLVICAVGRTVK